MATMVKSMALEGIEGFPVEIEAATIRGQQQMISVIGLGDQAVKEAGERMQAAMSCCGYDLPKDKTLISLAPGNRRKRVSHYDLGMTLALLAETDQIAAKDIDQYVFIGELSLDGRIRPCTGVLSMITAARQCGIRKACVPAANLKEAEKIGGIEAATAGPGQRYDTFMSIMWNKLKSRPMAACFYILYMYAHRHHIIEKTSKCSIISTL